jgi:hypothetical protein
VPVLKEYADSNDKCGYYVHAHVSGLSHPLPLQTPEVTEEIYRELGYEPIKPGDDGGVNVPKHLTWTLFDVALHWTENSGPQGDDSDLDFDDLREVAGLDLTTDDIEAILDLTEDYRGQYQSRVKELREEFSDDTGGSTDPESGGGSETALEELFEEFSDEPSFDQEVERMLENWQPNRLKPDDYDPDEHDGFFSQHYTTHSEYREALDSVPDLKTRLQEYEEHPWEVQTVRAVSGNSEEDSNGLKIEFGIDDVSEINEWNCRDYRESIGTPDFKFSTGIGNHRSYTFEVEDNYISDFDMTITHEGVGKFDIQPEDFWGYEVENQDPNEMMHTLVTDFQHLISIIEKFFGGITSYDLESTEPGDHSVYLP